MTNPQTKTKRAAFALTLVCSAMLLFVGIVYPDQLSAVYSGTHSILGTSSPVVRLGKIPLLETTQKEVRLFNFHTQPITISQVGASCGCTTAKSKTDVIRPFTFGAVSVSISPSHMGAGSESITLQTNVGGQNIPVSFTAVQH